MDSHSTTATANPRQGNGEEEADPPWAQPQGVGGEDVEEDHPKAPATRRRPGRRRAPVAVELGSPQPQKEDTSDESTLGRRSSVAERGPWVC